jgi:hypothetical protein
MYEMKFLFISTELNTPKNIQLQAQAAWIQSHYPFPWYVWKDGNVVCCCGACCMFFLIVLLPCFTRRKSNQHLLHTSQTALQHLAWRNDCSKAFAEQCSCSMMWWRTTNPENGTMQLQNNEVVKQGNSSNTIMQNKALHRMTELQNSVVVTL